MYQLLVSLLLMDLVDGHLIPTMSKYIEIITYNTDLYPAVNKNVDFRCKKQIEAFSEYLRTDGVICLQGVMFRHHLNEIVEAMSAKLPYSVSFTHTKTNAEQSFQESSEYKPPCNSEDSIILDSIDICYDRECMFASPDPTNIFKCGRIKPDCNDMLNMLSQNCVTCLILGDREDAPEKTCKLKRKALNVSGLLILSGLKISKIETGLLYNETEKTIMPTAFIKVIIDSIGPFVCTQMTSNFENEEFDVNGRPYDVQNKEEAEWLVEAVKNDVNVIIAGDMGYSRLSTTDKEGNSKRVLEKFPDTYEVLRNAGLEKRYSHYQSDCSVCFGSHMFAHNQIYSGWSGFKPDQILIRRTEEAIESQDVRHNHEPLTSRLLPKNELYFLSRHYAIRIEISNLKWVPNITHSSEQDDDSIDEESSVDVRHGSKRHVRSVDVPSANDHKESEEDSFNQEKKEHAHHHGKNDSGSSDVPSTHDDQESEEDSSDHGDTDNKEH